MIRIVDGGYVAWVYGTRPAIINMWTSIRHDFIGATGNLILMDDPNSHRRQFFPAYKEDRHNREGDDPARTKRREMVEFFKREIMWADPSVVTVGYYGMEADDLVAVMATRQLLDIPVDVVGIDKDLLQFPGDVLRLTKVGGDERSISDFAKKLPKSVGGYVKEPRQVLLTLALMGDSSDSVPRLIPKGNLHKFRSIINNKIDPFTQAYEEFGEEFLRNLYITVLPGPWCYSPVPTPQDVRVMLDRRMYLGQRVNQHLRYTLNKALAQVVLLQNERTQHGGDNSWLNLID